MDPTSTARHIALTRGSRHRRLPACVFGLVVLMIVVAGVGRGEFAHADPPTDKSASLPAATVESIESLQKRAAESTDLDADTKQKIEAACLQSIGGLDHIAELSKKAEQFGRDVIDVQSRVTALRRKLTELQQVTPSPPTYMTLAKLEQEVSRREVDLAQLKASQAQSEAEPSARAERRREVRTLLLSASQTIAELQKQIDLAETAGTPDMLNQARRVATTVRRMTVEAQQPALQNELAKYDAEDAVDFLRRERDVRKQEVAVASAELELLQKLLSRRRAADTAAAVQRARDTLASIPTELQAQAQENVTLAEAVHALSQPIENARRDLDEAKTLLDDVQKQFATTRQRVEDLGLTGSVGLLLRRQRADLPDLRRLKRNASERTLLIDDTQYRLFQYDDMRSETTEAPIQHVSETSPVGNRADGSSMDAAALSLAEQHRAYLDRAIRACNTYLDTLLELDANEQLLINEAEQYRDYVDGRILWVRSNGVLFSSFETDASDAWALQVGPWSEVSRHIIDDCRANPLVYAASMMAFVLLLWQKPRLRRELEATGENGARELQPQFAPTMRAAFLTLLLAVAWPGVMGIVAWRLSVSSNGSQFARATSQALFAMSSVCFPLELLRQVCRQRGLAELHFDWPASAIGVLRANLRWALAIGLFFVFITSLLYFSDAEHGVDSTERVFFVAGMLVLAIFLRRVLRPESGMFREYIALHPNGWLGRLRPIWYSAGVLFPAVFAGMAILGYYYTAQQLTWRFFASFVFVVALQLLWAMLNRLLLVRRRNISIEQTRQRRAANVARREQSTETAPHGPDQIVPVDESQADIAASTEQSQRLIRTGLLAASLVGMWLIWVDVLPALRVLDEWPVWTTTVSAPAEMNEAISLGPTATRLSAETTTTAQPTEVLRTVTVADICLAILIAVVTIVCARNVPGLMEMSILQRLPLDNSIRYAVTRVTSYIIVLVGVILTFNAISVGWSKVQWLVTALTFGLAFGLQEIFANFVAGIILLFERPIRVGDVVTVDDVTGVVSKTRIRATTITNWDRKEYVIPNKEFITGRMLNWTLSDKTNRIVINVGVAYGSDIQRAKQLLLEVCTDHPLTLDDPPTVVTFEEFGSNSLNLVVRTFLPDLNNRLQVIDQLHTTINDEFRQAGIEIAFPQNDLHLRSVDQSVCDIFSREAGRKAA